MYCFEIDVNEFVDILSLSFFTEHNELQLTSVLRIAKESQESLMKFDILPIKEKPVTPRYTEVNDTPNESVC